MSLKRLFMLVIVVPFPIMLGAACLIMIAFWPEVKQWHPLWFNLAMGTTLIGPYYTGLLVADVISKKDEQ